MRASSLSVGHGLSGGIFVFFSTDSTVKAHGQRNPRIAVGLVRPLAFQAVSCPELEHNEIYHRRIRTHYNNIFFLFWDKSPLCGANLKWASSQDLMFDLRH